MPADTSNSRHHPDDGEFRTATTLFKKKNNFSDISRALARVRFGTISPCAVVSVENCTKFAQKITFNETV